MARLPNRTTLGSSTPRAVSGGIDVSGLTRQQYYTGAAIGNLGEAAARLGRDISARIEEDQKEREKTERTLVNSQMLQFEQNQNNAFRDAADQMPVGGDGFSGGVLSNYDRAARQFVDSVPEHVRQDVIDKLVSRRASIEDAAGRAQRQETRRYVGEQVDRGQNVLLQRVTENPTGLPSIQREGLDLIDGMPGLSPAEKDDLKGRWRTAVQNSALQTRIADPNSRLRGGPVSASGGTQITPWVQLSDRAGAEEYNSVDPRLRHAMEVAAERRGWRIEIRSGKEDRDSGFHPKGTAMDVWILDAQGNRIGHGAGGTSDRPELASSKALAAKNFSTYETLAHDAHKAMRELYGDVANDFRWGGYFSGGPQTYGALDTMHFDLGGGAMAGGSFEKGLNPSERAAWEASGFSFDPAQSGGYAPSNGGYPELPAEAFLGEGYGAAPMGLQNNNPLNLKWTGTDYQTNLYPGMVGPSTEVGNGKSDQGDPQIVFSSPYAGMTAAARRIMDVYNGGRNTVRKLVSDEGGWTGGNVAAAQNVASRMGVGIDDAIDLQDPAVLKSYMESLLTQEQGAAGDVYRNGVIDYAINDVLGNSFPDADPGLVRRFNQEAAKRVGTAVNNNLDALSTELALQHRGNYEAQIDALYDNDQIAHSDRSKLRQQTAEKVSLFDTRERLAEGSVFYGGDKADRDAVNLYSDRLYTRDQLAEGDPQAVTTAMQLIERTGIIPANVRDTIDALMKSGDPERLQRGVELLNALKEASPRAYESTANTGGFSDRARQEFESVASFSKYYEGEELVKMLRNRKDMSDEAKKELKDLDLEGLVSEFDDSYWSDPQISPEKQAVLAADYETIYGQLRGQFPDAAEAREATLARLGRVWSASNVTGNQRLMQYAPERLLPPLGGRSPDTGSYDWVSDQLREFTDGREDVTLVATPDARRGIPRYHVISADAEDLGVITFDPKKAVAEGFRAAQERRSAPPAPMVDTTQDQNRILDSLLAGTSAAPSAMTPQQAAASPPSASPVRSQRAPALLNDPVANRRASRRRMDPEAQLPTERRR